MNMSYIILQAAYAEEEPMQMTNGLPFLVIQILLVIAMFAILFSTRKQVEQSNGSQGKSLLRIVTFIAVSTSIMLILHVLAYAGLIFS